VLVCRSLTLAGNTRTLDGIPITTPERTVIDLASKIAGKPLARMVREAMRLGATTPSDLFVVIARHRGRRGNRRLYEAVSRYAGLPLDRTQSDAEALAIAILRDAGRPVDDHNVLIEGEEADLIWHDARLIIEIDGPQFHLDAAEDLRKQRIWEAAGWTVRRVSSDDVYLLPHRLIALAPAPNVHAGTA
jgi:very-short-patch-repair endonuclease